MTDSRPNAPAPLYSRENCSFSCPLQWGLSAFWRTPMSDDGWLADLIAATEPDGIRILGHRFAKPGVSQFAISTLRQVSPRQIVQRVKGRLQYLVRGVGNCRGAAVIFLCKLCHRRIAVDAGDIDAGLAQYSCQRQAR